MRFNLLLISLLQILPYLQCQTANAQHQGIPQYYAAADTSTGLFLDLENLNFFSNNEYNSDQLQGYSLLGTWLNGSIRYRYNEVLSLEGGVQFKRFFGADSMASRSPFFLRAKFNPTPKLTIIFGELDHHHYWTMPRQMLDLERLYTHSREEGLQIRYAGERFFKGETWLNWERMIYKGSAFREQLTAGLTGKFMLLNKPHLSIEIPINYIAKHWGGEIDIAPKLAETLANSGIGLDVQKKYAHTSFKQVGVSFNVFSYQRSGHSTFTPYANGFALYPKINAQIKQSYLAIGYWQSDGFAAYWGDPMYANYLGDQVFGKRSMLDCSYHWDYHWSDDLFFSLRAQAYYDLNSKIIDLRAGIILHIKEAFRLRAYDKK